MKNFIFIGGSYGIGLSTINRLIDQEHHVYAYSRTKGELSPESKFLHHTTFDVSKEDFCLEGLPSHCDGFVYFPGTINLRPFTSFNEEDFYKDYQLNFVSMVIILKRLFLF